MTFNAVHPAASKLPACRKSATLDCTDEQKDDTHEQLKLVASEMIYDGDLTKHLHGCMLRYKKQMCSASSQVRTDAKFEKASTVGGIDEDWLIEYISDIQT